MNLLMEKIKIFKIIKYVLFYLYLVSALCVYVPSIYSKFCIYLNILIGLFSLPLHLSRLYKKHRLLYLIFYIMIIGLFICSLIVKKGFIFISILILSAVSGVIFLLKENLNISIVSLIFIGVFSYYSYYFNIVGNIYLILVEQSRNSISISMIFAVSFVYIAYHQANKLIPLWPAIITFIVSVQAIGRSGIISTGLLLIGIILLRIIKMRNLFKKLLTTIIIIIIIYYVFFFNYDFLSHNYFYYLESNKFESEGREEIWSYYFNQIENNPLYFIFGTTNEDSYMINKWNNNYHNSFISLHSRIGIFAIPVMVAMVASLFRYWSNNKLYFLLLLVFSVRSFSDEVIFFLNYDFLFYYLILESFINNKKVRNCCDLKRNHKT